MCVFVALGLVKEVTVYLDLFCSSADEAFLLDMYQFLEFHKISDSYHNLCDSYHNLWMISLWFVVLDAPV